jgi:phospholipase A1
MKLQNDAVTGKTGWSKRLLAACTVWVVLALPTTGRGQSSYEVTKSPLESRIESEATASKERFVLIPHRPNYFLPLTFNSNPNDEPHLGTPGLSDGLDEFEVKFQLSFKVPLWREIFNDKSSLWFAYTQVSYWQLYKWDESAPFRETNFMPEVFLVFRPRFEVLGLRGDLAFLGLIHHSNGRAGDLSRSWNRLYAQIVLSRGRLFISLKPWWRIPESEADDNNPDIEDFYGPGEIALLYGTGNQTFSLMVRNNLDSDHRGAVQAEWTFPLSERFTGYFQIFNGYGESLIDYNHSVKRVGLGVALTTWM